ncbi:MAG: hypothetical protein KF802_02935 [Bdellovibrionaceae bacterium]|nr:hypothetical protein [Pseudobdellovibrionaceae bacterium]
MFGEDWKLKKKLNDINDTISKEGNVGLALCAVGLAEIFLNSKTERRKHSLRYLQEGRLRAIADIQDGVPHGDLLAFYPGGKIWIKGYYRKGKMVHEAFTLFMPDGSIAPQSPRNNVIPLPKKQ